MSQLAAALYIHEDVHQALTIMMYQFTRLNL
jgi:hypothetical protein